MSTLAVVGLGSSAVYAAIGAEGANGRHYDHSRPFGVGVGRDIQLHRPEYESTRHRCDYTFPDASQCNPSRVSLPSIPIFPHCLFPLAVARDDTTSSVHRPFSEESSRELLCPLPSLLPIHGAEARRMAYLAYSWPIRVMGK